MNAAEVAHFDQTLAGTESFLDQMIHSFRVGAEQFDEMTNIIALANVLSEHPNQADVADLAVCAIRRLASGGSLDTPGDADGR